MSDLGLGEIITTEQHRDAIHVAVVPITAAIDMYPGENVCLTVDKNATRGPGESVGIVDPYLKNKVMAMEKFWLFLYPNTVTGIRHHWSHPAFTELDNSETKRRELAMEVINNFAKGLPEYEEEAAPTGQQLLRDVGSGQFYLGFDLDYEFIHQNEKEFWRAVETVTGTPQERQGFSCAC